MVRFAPLLGLMALASPPNHIIPVDPPPGVDVARWLEGPGVRYVAVRFAARDCPPCREDARHWQELVAEHEGRGLLAVEMTDQGPRGGCFRPGYQAHVTRCFGIGTIRQAWAIPTNQPVAFLWDWKGRLLAARVDGARIAQIFERIPPRPRLRLSVIPGRNTPASLREKLWTALREDGLVTPILSTRADQLPAGACGTPPGRGPYQMIVQPTENRHEATLFSRAGCVAKIPIDTTSSYVPPRFPTPNVDPPPSDTVERAAKHVAQQVRRALIGPVQMPTIPERDHADPSGTPIAGADAILREFARNWSGVPYRHDGDDRAGIDAPALARAAIMKYRGFDIGRRMLDQLESGSPVPVSERNPEANLQPGDLLFLVTHGFSPRGVMVYLGAGQVLKTGPIIGAEIGPLPRTVSQMLHLVARRPERP